MLPGGQQTASMRCGDGCLAAAHLQFAAGILDVVVDGAFGNVKNSAYFPAGFSHRGPVQTFELAIRQRLH